MRLLDGAQLHRIGRGACRVVLLLGVGSAAAGAQSTASADSAFAHLERAIAAGVDLEMVTTHVDLTSIRGDVRYPRIVQRLEDRRFPCRRGVEPHQFDFWIGEWSVTKWADPPTAAPVGQNVVTTDLEACVVLEAWTPRVGGNGRSMNFWDTNRRAWRQVFDASEDNGAT